jgi:large subunit ribosomal protein L28
MVGHNVSHANNKSKRRFNPNLQEHRFWLESEKRYIKLRVSRKGMRIIDKLGLEQVLKDIKEREQEEGK